MKICLSCKGQNRDEAWFCGRCGRPFSMQPQQEATQKTSEETWGHMSSVPYGVIADCFRNHSVVPFLGAAASFVGAAAGSALPGGSKFAEMLAQKAGYPGLASDSLTKIAQFVEEIAAGRDYLLTEIASIFHDGIASSYHSAFTDFLAALPLTVMPKLIMTTNYDTLVERTFEEKIKIPYFTISHIMGNSKFTGRYLCYGSLNSPLDKTTILTIDQLEERLLEIEERDPSHVLIYKMHGTSKLRSESGMLDSVVLTEDDYIDFLARDKLKKIPTRVIEMLRTDRLLFLGYSLVDWNFRVLLQRLSLIQKKEEQNQKRHWACIAEADEVEIKFWDRRGINLYCQSLEIFLRDLRQAI